MKKIIFLFSAIISFSTFAQFINKGNIKISSGTYLYVSGLDLKNDNGTTYTWSNDGNVIFKGNTFINDGTMDDEAEGTTEFSGDNEQYITGNSTVNYHNLNINNTNNSVVQQTIVDTDNLTVADGAKDFDYKVETELPLYVNDVTTLDGAVRLEGTSQLVQTHSGVTTNGGSNHIFIDQQGTTNQYWFNYWSSPVNRGGTWKMGYLRDGATGDNESIANYPDIVIANNTNATNDINNAGESHPVILNAYWVFAFKNGEDGSYDGWYDNHIQDTGTVLPGEGYTMKGPGVDADLNAANGSATTIYESWTFSGTPNDGDYSLTIDANHDYLIGNPYPSALDANQFIEDNISEDNGGNNTSDIFNGTLYFWEQTGGDDHYGAGYEGGYATYTLSGGVKATSWDGSGEEVGTKEPQQYIPVGQGFFVWAEEGQGGSILFNNNQRAFVTEGESSVFFRPAALTNIRLGFNTTQNYHRQLLLAVRDNTTDGVDAGWDGPNFDGDSYPGADLRWNIENKDYIIQAVPQITIDSRLPLNVLVSDDGLVSFNTDLAENLPADISDIFIEDAYDQTYHKISNNEVFEVYLQAGTYNDRFYLRFSDPSLNAEENSLENIIGYFDATTDELVILNKENNLLKSINLFALTGQKVFSYDKTTSDLQIRIPVRLTTGIYLLTVASFDNKVYTTKIIVK